MTLKEHILWIFETFHKGKNHPLRRVDLLYDLRNHQITDREMRQAYEDLPVCGSSRGLYLPETQAEIDEQIELHMKKVYAYWRKIKILREYKIESDPIQKDLF